MLGGFDDGPLKGKATGSMPKTNNAITLKVKFGEMRIAASANRLYVGAFDRKGRTRCVRILTGAHDDRFLKRFEPTKIGLSEYEAGTVLRLFVDGERLTLYVRPNGRFGFYSHSW